MLRPEGRIQEVMLMRFMDEVTVMALNEQEDLWLCSEADDVEEVLHVQGNIKKMYRSEERTEEGMLMTICGGQIDSEVFSESVVTYKVWEMFKKSEETLDVHLSKSVVTMMMCYL